MHELGIAVEVVGAVSARAGKNRVKRVIVQIGALCAVLPDALRFCFDLAAEGTIVQGAKLEILLGPGRARCRACSSELELFRPFGSCPCGGTELDFLTGDELRVCAMELE